MSDLAWRAARLLARRDAARGRARHHRGNGHLHDAARAALKARSEPRTRAGRRGESCVANRYQPHSLAADSR